ncbi:MAG: transglutaminase-like cysteine peptidase [Pseudomonadota bacterium]
MTTRLMLAIGLILLLGPLALALDAAQLAALERQYGAEARQRAESWQQLLDGSAGLAEMDKLREVNRFFNRLAFVSDREHWGREDYWATPLEFLGSGGGDCEDFAVAKYFSLKALGVPVDRLRLTYVKAVQLNEAHMVLTYYPEPSAEPLVLDNLVPDIRLASGRRDLVPVYSFNADGLWLAKERGLGRFVGKADRLSRWTELQRRMARETGANP